MSDVEQGPELIVRTCPECDKPFEGPRVGPNSAGFLLGNHRYRDHGVKGSKRTARAKKAGVTDEDMAARPVLGVVRDMADAVGNRRGAPTAEELAAGLGRGLGLVSTAVASYAAETDPTIAEGPEGERQRDQLVDYLALNDKAARDVMRPFGKAFAPTGVNKRYGRAVVENVDLVASIAEVVELGVHWRRYFRSRSMASRPIDTTAVLRATEGAPPAMADLEPDAPVMPTTPAPQEGVVVTPAMVAAMQRERR